MNPSGLHVNKPVVAAIGIGVLVVVYLWFSHSSSTSPSSASSAAVKGPSMETLEAAKASVDKVTVTHNTSLVFKVEGKERVDGPSMDNLEAVKASVDKVTVTHNTSLIFKVEGKERVKGLSMENLEAAKASVAKVTVTHNTSLIFKVEGKDVKIAYREVTPAAANKKLDILFLHGMRFKSETWVSPPVKTLQLMYNLNYRAVAIDLPGFGDSPSAEVNRGEFIKAAIDALKLDKPVIVSPSMSGSFALPYLFSDPESAASRCRGYVPVAPIDTEKYADKYKQSKVPTLVIYGSKDSTYGFPSRDNLKNIPTSKVVELPDAGHACYLDKPDEFHQHLQAFLAGLL